MPHPLIFGHRGASAEAPENTMRAFRLALAQGADGVELDVQRSADGVPVVIHDPTLERTTDGEGPVSARTAAALAGVRSRGEPVPTLDEVARWAAEAGAWVNVEIKDPAATDAAVRVCRDAGIADRTVFSSFDAGTVRRVGEVAPDATRYFLTERWDGEVLAVVREIGAMGVCLERRAATPAALASLAAEALPAVVWTVDDPAEVRRLLEAGVRAVISNVPALAVAARAEV
jgi:glycerophosphoryl diester phosphodiesterase